MVSAVSIETGPGVIVLRLLGVEPGCRTVALVLGHLGRAGIEPRSLVRTDNQVVLLMPASSRALLPAAVDGLRGDGVVQEATIGPDAVTVTVSSLLVNARPEIRARMFRALSRQRIDSDCVSASDARICGVVGYGDRERALAALSEEFVEELAWERTETECYGATGSTRRHGATEETV
jgi:aspartokinase